MMTLRFFCIALIILVSIRAFAAEPIVLPLEPKLDPAIEKNEPIRNLGQTPNPAHPFRFISGIVYPTLTVYVPENAKGPTPAVVICPGGGYGGVAIDHEGHDVARWLNTIGVAGVVLKYRMPHFDPAKPDEKPLPLQDAQTTLRLVRSKAKEWNIDPKKVGIMGFSAGGHLASTAATHFDSPEVRPDFAILVYPVVTFKDPICHSGSRANLIGKKPSQQLLDLYSNELQVTAQTPPTFLVHSKDDPVKVQNSMLFHEACQKAGVSSELLLFEKGGHGYGMGIHGGDPATWPAKCAEWLKKQKIAESTEMK